MALFAISSFAASSPFASACFFSSLYASIADSIVLCTLKPYEPDSASPTTEANAVSFIATSSRRTRRYWTWIGRRAASFSHGAARTYDAAAAKSEAPNAGVNPSTLSIRPGRCCVPYSSSSGAIWGSMPSRMIFVTRASGTGANETSVTPIAARPARQPSTYAHRVSSAHRALSPRCRPAVTVSANLIVSGRAGANFSSLSLSLICLGCVMTRRKNARTVSGLGSDFVTFGFDVPSSGSHDKNRPSWTETTSMR